MRCSVPLACREAGVDGSLGGLSMRYSQILVFSTRVTGRALLISGSDLCQQRSKNTVCECWAWDRGWGSDQSRLAAFPGCSKRKIPKAISSHLAHWLLMVKNHGITESFQLEKTNHSPWAVYNCAKEKGQLGWVSE